VAAHTHGLSQHTHSLSDHLHDISNSITTVYGIFREDASNTFAIGELEYRVNSGAWADLNGAEDQGSGWYFLDITDSVMDPDTFRPLLTNNTMNVRAKSGAAISSMIVAGSTLIINMVGLADEALVGKFIFITGATGYNGVYLVASAVGSDYTCSDVVSSGEHTGGALLQLKTVTIDSLFSVRNIIQAVAYA
jgi:hypothetical protein